MSITVCLNDGSGVVVFVEQRTRADGVDFMLRAESIPAAGISATMH